MSGTTIHRGFLTLTVVLMLALGTAGYLAWRAWGPLGDPAAAGSWELWRWLSEKRLVEEPLPTRLALVGRLEEELRGGLELPNDATLTVAGPFRENCRLLESDWFYDRCQKWSTLTAEDAARYMQAQLDLLSKWLTAIPDEKTSSAHAPPAESLSQKIERWLREAPAPQKDASLAAVRAGLFQWLCTTDLAKADSAGRLDLANRITVELDSKRDLSSRLGNLSAEQRARLRANGWLLAQAWWTGQARSFAALPDAQRDPFATGLLERLEKWDLSALQENPGNDTKSAAADSAGGPLAKLVAELERWAEAAEPTDAAAMRQLSSRVGKVLAMRALKRLWGG